MQGAHVSGEMEHAPEIPPNRATHLPKLPTFIQVDRSLRTESEILKNVVLDPSQSQSRDPQNSPDVVLVRLLVSAFNPVSRPWQE